MNVYLFIHLFIYLFIYLFKFKNAYSIWHVDIHVLLCVNKYVHDGCGMLGWGPIFQEGTVRIFFLRSSAIRIEQNHLKSQQTSRFHPNVFATNLPA